MKFGKEIVTPSYTRTPTFDSTGTLERSYVFECINCSSMVGLEVEKFIGKEYGWREDFDKNTQQQITQHYNMNSVGKAPDGGWTAIDTFQCGNCSTKYLVYAGISEVANSAYKVTVQGITEIIDEQN